MSFKTHVLITNTIHVFNTSAVMTVMPHVGSEGLAEKYKTAKRTGDIYFRFYVLIYLAT